MARAEPHFAKNSPLQPFFLSTFHLARFLHLISSFGAELSPDMASASSSNLRLQAFTTSDSQSEFIQFRASMRLPIAPRWAADGTAGAAAGTGGMEGVKEVLASWVMR